MKIVSWLLTLLVFFLALSFALANRQSATVNLWPFDMQVSAPFYLFTLGVFFVGILIGAIFGWLNAFPVRMEARRLKKDIAGLREKIGALQHTGMPQRRKQDRQPQWRLWGRQG